MKMHDRDDVNALRLDAIQETVGELRNEETPKPPAKRCSRNRKLRQSFVRVLNGGDEVESEAFAFALVELSC